MNKQRKTKSSVMPCMMALLQKAVCLSMELLALRMCYYGKNHKQSITWIYFAVTSANRLVHSDYKSQLQ